MQDAQAHGANVAEQEAKESAECGRPGRDFGFQAAARAATMGTVKDVLATMRAWDEAGLRSAEAILVGTQHSSPRQPGARLAVNERGEAAGGVSMGCVESDLREHLLALLRGAGAPRMVHYGAAFAAALEVGLSCGGEIDVWLRPHDAAATAWRALNALQRNERAILLTELGGASPQLLLRPGEPGPTPEMAAALAELWKRGGTRRIAAGDGNWFAEAVFPDPHLLIVGSSPIAIALCDLAARTGFRVSVVDPRRDFARAELYPAAERVVHEWPTEGLAAAGLDEHAYVAVVAHDARLDVPALAAALRAQCAYVGLLGSRGTQADRRAALREAGFAEADMARIRGPIGLKGLGAVEPAEIAVAILAELIMARRGALAAAEIKTGVEP